MSAVGPSSWSLHGQALTDWLHGDKEAFVEVVDDAGEVDRVRAEVFFRGPDALEDWELLALAACEGRVLDLGAGAGCHALALQQRGLPVTALEVSREAVEVMARRGVADARWATATDWSDVALRPGAADSSAGVSADQRFETMLMLMHGAGLAGDLDGLVALLAQVQDVLVPGGALLLDSRDPGCGAAVAELCIRYQGRVGQPFDWLYLDAETLCDMAQEAGFEAEQLWSDDSGRHLCRLQR